VRTVLYAMLLGAGCAVAQTNGRLTGSVVDPTGAAVPKATVSLLLHGGKRALLATLTNNEGSFTIESVRPETYDVVVDAPGFESYRLENARIDSARSTDLAEIKLSLAAAATSIEVSGGAETVQTSSTAVATTITSDQIQRLPVADRNPLAFISTQAGVSAHQFATGSGNRSAA
jgi:hypothetical protein